MIDYILFDDTRQFHYDDAWLLAATLYHNNKSDWRLPSKLEYQYNKTIHPDAWFEGDSMIELRYRPLQLVRTL